MKDSAELLTRIAAVADEAPLPANENRRFAIVHDTAVRPAPKAARAVPASWRAGLHSASYRPGSWGDAF